MLHDVLLSTAPSDFERYLVAHENKSVLRFITCGSVDDGKSTLIGRLLFETRSLYDDQLGALEKDSRKHGTQGDAIDYALILDGLAAEREQGITIDVAYRFFSTAACKFIVADCPGHEQYTRNMATGASTADLAIVLVDARKGLLTQTRRHSFILALLGIKRVILAINKMDAVDYQEAIFRQIESDYRALGTELGIGQISAIPLSALVGDNLISSSACTPWYAGKSLLETLEAAALSGAEVSESTKLGFRLPVQLVLRPNQDFRGFAGTIAQGEIAVGDRIGVNGNAKALQAQVTTISRGTQWVACAHAGDSVVLTLDSEIDVSRGDVLTCLSQTPMRSDQFDAKLLWMAPQPLQLGQSFRLKLGTRTVNARVEQIKYLIDVDTQAQRDCDVLELNDVALCKLRLDQVISLERYSDSRILGGFILIDRHDHATVAAGTVIEANSSNNVRWQPMQVSHAERTQQKRQKPKCIWFTGLSGAGKSTLASGLDRALTDAGQHVYVLDGDNLRHGLTRYLGFSDSDRKENVRLVAEAAKLMVDAGLVVLVSLISPFRGDRDAARALFGADEFVEVFVDTALAVAESRDVKGLYAKARSGQLRGFTGIDSPYEAPLKPEVHLQTQGRDLADLIGELVRVVTRG
jgi:bifunctional enzyme CysN/CysC